MAEPPRRLRHSCTLAIANGVQKNTGAKVLALDCIEVDGLDDCDEPPDNVVDVCVEEGLLEFVKMEEDVAVIIVNERLKVRLNGNGYWDNVNSEVRELKVAVNGLSGDWSEDLVPSRRLPTYRQSRSHQDSPGPMIHHPPDIMMRSDAAVSFHTRTKAT